MKYMIEKSLFGSAWQEMDRAKTKIGAIRTMKRLRKVWENQDYMFRVVLTEPVAEFDAYCLELGKRGF